MISVLFAAALGAKLLIVHADDLGMSHSVDVASIRALESGLVTSASIMVPCPWFSEIAAWAREHPDADLGLHLTLTSEWKSYRWRPLLGLASLIDREGFLYATESEAAAHIDPREAEAEIRAQIARARAAGIRPTHLDSHMGTLYQTRELFQVLLRVARDEKIPARITRQRLHTSDARIDQIITIGADVAPAKWKEWYTDQIRKIKPGVTEVIIHLAHDDAEMRAITSGHPLWGAAWRQCDFDFFTSDEFRRLLRENDIQLTTWRDLR
jgi:chitin disaccharide deacetylase